MGRRAQKVVSTNKGTIWVAYSTNRFIYDLAGWNLLATVDHQGKVLQPFVWGQDLSRGREAHKSWNPGEGFLKEKTIKFGKGGMRVDAIDLVKKNCEGVETE